MMPIKYRIRRGLPTTWHDRNEGRKHAKEHGRGCRVLEIKNSTYCNQSKKKEWAQEIILPWWIQIYFKTSSALEVKQIVLWWTIAIHVPITFGIIENLHSHHNSMSIWWRCEAARSVCGVNWRLRQKTSPKTVSYMMNHELTNLQNFVCIQHFVGSADSYTI